MFLLMCRFRFFQSFRIKFLSDHALCSKQKTDGMDNTKNLRSSRKNFYYLIIVKKSKKVFNYNTIRLYQQITIQESNILCIDFILVLLYYNKLYFMIITRDAKMGFDSFVPSRMPTSAERKIAFNLKVEGSSSSNLIHGTKRYKNSLERLKKIINIKKVDQCDQFNRLIFDSFCETQVEQQCRKYMQKSSTIQECSKIRSSAKKRQNWKKQPILRAHILKDADKKEQQIRVCDHYYTEHQRLVGQLNECINKRSFVRYETVLEIAKKSTKSNMSRINESKQEEQQKLMREKFMNKMVRKSLIALQGKKEPRVQKKDLVNCSEQKQIVKCKSSSYQSVIHVLEHIEDQNEKISRKISQIQKNYAPSQSEVSLKKKNQQRLKNQSILSKSLKYNENPENQRKDYSLSLQKKKKLQQSGTKRYISKKLSLNAQKYFNPRFKLNIKNPKTHQQDFIQNFNGQEKTIQSSIFSQYLNFLQRKEKNEIRAINSQLKYPERKPACKKRKIVHALWKYEVKKQRAYGKMKKNSHKSKENEVQGSDLQEENINFEYLKTINC